MFSVVIPILGTAAAAERLGGDADTATAIALDTVTALLNSTRVSRVVVLVDSPLLVEQVSQAIHDANSEVSSAVILDRSPQRPAADTGEEPSLNEAVAATTSQLSGRIAVVHSALPTLTPAALDGVLRTAEAEPFAAVASTNSAATVLVTAVDPAHLKSSFGQRSFARHVALGAKALTAEPELTLMGDTPGQVANLLSSPTLGARTRAATKSWRVVPRDRSGEPHRRNLPDPQPAKD